MTGKDQQKQKIEDAAPPLNNHLNTMLASLSRLNETERLVQHHASKTGLERIPMALGQVVFWA